MLIVPVLDLMRGQAVHARRGERARYQPLRSRFAADASPAALVDGLACAMPLRQLYIADLDALTNGVPDVALVMALAARHPQVRFLLDAGLRTPADATIYLTQPNIDLVIATETVALVQDYAPLCDAIPHDRRILSLDRRSDTALGCAELFSNVTHWPSRLIHMNLDRVGGEAGPDIAGIETLHARARATGASVAVYAAGGVRDEDDLARLAAAGAAGVLVGTALHGGTLDPTRLERYT